MRVIPVESADGAFFLRRDGKVILLLARGGGPLPVLPEWAPGRVLTGAEGVSVMQMRHVSGDTATWFLDADFRYVTNSFEDLPATWQSALRAAVPAYPIIAWDELSAAARAPVRRDTPACPGAPDAIASIALDGVRLFNPIAPRRLAALTRFWKRNDHVVVRDALSADAVRLLERHITFEQLQALDDPRQFHRVHNDDVCREFINRFLTAARPFYEAVLGLDLLPTYGFAMKYIQNSDMDPHYDNLHNPISSTVCYHFTPQGAKNPLLLDKAKFANPYTQRMTVADKDGIPARNVVRMDLEPGDLAVFRGRNHLHWREAIATDMDYRALLLHFSDFKYKGAIVKGRPIPHVIDSLVDVDNYDGFREAYAMYFEQNGDWE